MSCFTHMAQTLARNPWVPARVVDEPQQRATSKTERIREHLRTHGWANSHTLAIEADVPQAALVGALLKNDLARGRVLREGSGYAWNTSWDEQEASEIRSAISLLKRRGYIVKKGDPK